MSEPVFEQDEIPGQAVAEPPRYVTLAMEGQLPEAVEELGRWLEGRGMRHLVVLDVGR